MRIVSTAPSRARQINTGAAIARGEVLLFLHADTKAPFGFSSQIKNCLSDTKTTVGAFRFALDDTRLLLQLIEFGVNARSKALGLPFGDQGLFLRRTIFNEAGGFRDLPNNGRLRLGCTTRPGRPHQNSLDYCHDVCPALDHSWSSSNVTHQCPTNLRLESGRFASTSGSLAKPTIPSGLQRRFSCTGCEKPARK